MDKIKMYDFKPLPLEIEIKDLSFIKKAPHLLGKPHQTSFYQLIWLIHGEMTLYVDFQRVTLHQGELLLLTCGQVCQFDTKSNYSGFITLFTPAFFAESDTDTQFLYSSEILSPLTHNSGLKLPNSLIKHLINALQEELNRPKDNFQAYIARSYLRILLFEMERSTTKSQNSKEFREIRNFVNEVERHYKEERTVSFYAKLLLIEERKLNQCVLKTIGKTAKQYIDSRIILEAKRFLSYSDKSVKEIGFSLGFDEPTNFNKYFKKHTKQTPLEFKSSLKQD
ncbi:MAG: AraC family transcriptional regulator [Bacteroidales bacterium]|nr:AraC family transcriptional regulator [Bacteroidales bacterium]